MCQELRFCQLVPDLVEPDSKICYVKQCVTMNCTLFEKFPTESFLYGEYWGQGVLMVSFVEVRILIQLSPLSQVMKPSFRNFQDKILATSATLGKQICSNNTGIYINCQKPRVGFFDHQTTLPKTNIFAPENGCLEYFLVSFWVSAYFQVPILC